MTSSDVTSFYHMTAATVANMASMKLVVFLALCAASVAAHSSQQFREWLAEHGQAVEGLDPTEVHSNWLANARFVEEHNTRGLSNYKLALNAFAHKVQHFYAC